MKWGPAHSRDYAAEAPITHDPIAWAGPQPALALAERQVVHEALHKSVQPVAAQDRVIAREIEVIEVAGAIVRTCIGAEGQLYAGAIASTFLGYTLNWPGWMLLPFCSDVVGGVEPATVGWAGLEMSKAVNSPGP